MAVLANHLLTNGSGVDQSSYVTGSFTPTSGKIVLIAIGNRALVASKVPTISGMAVTQITTRTTESGVGGDDARITLFIGIGTGVATSLTIDFDGETQINCGWSINEFSNTRTSGTNGINAIVQSATNGQNSQTTFSVTLGAFSDVANATYSAIFKFGTNDVDPGDGFTELGEQPLSSETCAIQTQWKDSNDTVADGEFIGSGGDTYSAVAVEIAAEISSESLSESVSVSLSPSLSASLSPSLSISLSPSASESPSSSISPSPSSSLSPSTSRSSSASLSFSSSISPSISASPSAGFTNYTRANESALPGDDTDLETAYTDQDEVKVETRNDQLVDQDGTREYLIHQFKVFIGQETEGIVEWEGKSTLSPKYSSVFLQIYNNNTNSWETIDTDNTSNKDQNIQLFSKISDFTNYKNASKVISCRVYQLAI